MKLPLKPDVTPTQFWATLIGGILLTALTTLSLLDAVWVGGAVAVLTIGYQEAQKRASRAEIEDLKAQIQALKNNPSPPADS